MGEISLNLSLSDSLPRKNSCDPSLARHLIAACCDRIAFAGRSGRRRQPAPAPPAAAAPAASLPDADPALWVVRDADTTIYLFGTFHLLDGRPWFNDEVRTAFDASDELVIECDPARGQGAMAPSDPALCDRRAGADALLAADGRAE